MVWVCWWLKMTGWTLWLTNDTKWQCGSNNITFAVTLLSYTNSTTNILFYTHIYTDIQKKTALFYYQSLLTNFNIFQKHWNRLYFFVYFSFLYINHLHVQQLEHVLMQGAYIHVSINWLRSKNTTKLWRGRTSVFIWARDSAVWAGMWSSLHGLCAKAERVMMDGLYLQG